MTPMMKARAFAEKKHDGQTYDGGSYVRNHLDHVVEVLVRFDVLYRPALVAAYLHDTVEDTSTTVEEIEREFGSQVATIVDLLTDAEGGNRRERQRKTYARMRLSLDAITVKLADRIANVEASLRADGKSYFGMYRKEHDFFRSMLFGYSQGLLATSATEAMWAHLDALLAEPWSVT